ncbi:hypothetical protein HD806DRAFT_384001 [Xylariaceae sp. AK1471]|nr:hypothetical protein HD806DRAFT_384001 [Xylariaceae sp. AK1471]
MAGHNFSRYMLSLWPALFAPFNFLFTRIWRFFTRATETKDIDTASPPSEKPVTYSSPSSLPAPTSTSTSTSTCTSTPTPTIPPPSTPNTSIITTTQPASPPALHDQNSSHSIAGEGFLDYTIVDSLNSEDNSTGLGHTTNFLPQDYQQQSIDMTRKRSNRGQGGARSSSHKPATTVTPVTPVPRVASVTPAADTINGWPVSTGQSDKNASGDTSFNPNHPNGPKSTSFKRGGSRARNRNSLATLPQQQPASNQKENAAPPKDSDPTSRTANSDTPALTPVAVTDKTSEPQKPGTRSYRAANAARTATALNTMCDGSSASSFGAEQLHVATNRLTLDDAPSSQQPAQQTLNEATAAAEASAVPVPLVVAVPILPQLKTAENDPQTPPAPTLPGLIEPTTDEGRTEREHHLQFMREALEMGALALRTNETPVGCVLVYRGRIVARGMNATNVTRNGTRHAEFMALSALLSRRELGDVKVADFNPELDHASWGDVDPKDGHIYPYGQKLHPAPVVDRSIISECVLYVTVEPCVMCASLLRQLGIKKVYFGAVNDKFGGTGGVFRVHMNSKPVTVPGDRPYQQGYGPQDLSLISKGRAVTLPRDDDDGDGGNVEPGYPVEGGYLRDDAVSLLRRFYVQENGRAPQPRKKEGRAARLYATLESQNTAVNASDLSDNTPETPVEAEAPMELGGAPAISVV